MLRTTLLIVGALMTAPGTAGAQGPRRGPVETHTEEEAKEIEAEAEAEAELGVGKEAGAGTEAEPETKAEPETEAEPEPEREREPETESEAEAEAETKSETETEIPPDSETGPAPDAHTEAPLNLNEDIVTIDETVGVEASGDVELVVLILPLKPDRVEAGLASTLDSVLAQNLARRDGYKVVTLADIDTMLKVELLKDLVGCDDVACATDVGGAVGADRILTGNVGRLGTKYVLSLQWVDGVYSSLIGRTQREAKDEATLARATEEGLSVLLGEVKEEDMQDRERKRRPTFWTVEVTGGPAWASSNEPYQTGFAATARLALGGRRRGGFTYYYGLIGYGLGRYPGKVGSSSTGRVTYNRFHNDIFAELRLAWPIASRGLTRLYLGAGIGAAFESWEFDQAQGLQSDGNDTFFEGRVVAGLWHRWSPLISTYAGYRLRLTFTGASADPIAEAVEIGSTQTVVPFQDVEIGFAFHF